AGLRGSPGTPNPLDLQALSLGVDAPRRVWRPGGRGRRAGRLYRADLENALVQQGPAGDLVGTVSRARTPVARPSAGPRWADRVRPETSALSRGRECFRGDFHPYHRHAGGL